MSRPPVKLAAEEFFPAVQKFNDTVGPLFAELKSRFPLDEHHESGLARSLGIFLGYCFRTANDALMKIRPEPLSRDAWIVASPETKHVHLHWQSNFKYLKQRNRYYVELMGLRGLSNGTIRDDENEADWLAGPLQDGAVASS